MNCPGQLKAPIERPVSTLNIELVMKGCPNDWTPSDVNTIALTALILDENYLKIKKKLKIQQAITLDMYCHLL